MVADGAPDQRGAAFIRKPDMATAYVASAEPVADWNAPVASVIAAMPPNSWKALPGTQMKDACPQPYRSGACKNVIAAWSGGAYDPARARMVIMGGGHSDSWYNNIFAFDLGPMKWTRLTEMSGGSNGTTPGPGWNDKRIETCGFYPRGELALPDSVMSGAYVAHDMCFVEPVLSQLDLQQPRSAHTYGNIFVDRVQDRYCNLSRSYYPSAQASSRVAVCFSPVTGQWSRIVDRPMNVGAGGQTAFDSAGNLWSVSGAQGAIGRLSLDRNEWTLFGRFNYEAGGGVDIDRRRNHLHVLIARPEGGHALRRWDLNASGSLRGAGYSEIGTTGDMPVGLGKRPGFVYVDEMDRFFAWGGGRDIYVLDPATATWQRFTGSGDDPGDQQKNGTYGRFRYIPGYGVFILVNSTTQDVFLYKPG